MEWVRQESATETYIAQPCDNLRFTVFFAEYSMHGPSWAGLVQCLLYEGGSIHGKWRKLTLIKAKSSAEAARQELMSEFSALVNGWQAAVIS